MPSFLTSGKTAALIGASRGWSFSNSRLVALPFSSGRFVFLIRLAEKGQRRPIGPGRGLDHVRDEPLPGLVVEVGQVLAAAAMPRLAFGVEFDDQFDRPARTSLPSMWLRRSKSPRWATPSNSPNSPGGEEREGVFDVGRAAPNNGSILPCRDRAAAAARRPVPGPDTTDSGGRANTCTTRAMARDGRRTRSPSARTRASGR